MRTNNVTDRNRCGICGEKFLEGNNFPRYRTSRTAVFRLYLNEHNEPFVLKGNLDARCVHSRPGADNMKQFGILRKEPVLVAKFH